MDLSGVSLRGTGFIEIQGFLLNVAHITEIGKSCDGSFYVSTTVKDLCLTAIDLTELLEKIKQAKGA